MTELTESFAKGRIPLRREMTGSWVAIGYLGDTSSLNCDGVTRFQKFEWVILANQYSVEMDIIGTHHQKATFKQDNRGSLALPVDFEGDSTPPYIDAV